MRYIKISVTQFYYYYTILHVSAYRQAIITCYLTILYNGQVTEYILCGSSYCQYYMKVKLLGSLVAKGGTLLSIVILRATECKTRK
jgi:hypothetical protein